MDHFFLDESGDFCFDTTSAYKHGVITIVSVDAHNRKKITNHLKREFSELYTQGWGKQREIKAAELFNERKFGAESIIKILAQLVNIHSLKIHYIIVNKVKITSPQLRNAPYGVAYNYFTGILLAELMSEDNFPEINLTYDLRNKETHPNMNFIEYVKIHLYATAINKNKELKFAIRGEDSELSFGLKAADFCSWSIFRNFESKDDRFYKTISQNLGRHREWYV